jgi:hypothetical protein
MKIPSLSKKESDNYNLKIVIIMEYCLITVIILKLQHHTKKQS